MKKQGMLSALISLGVVSAIALVVLLNVGYQARLVGPVMILLGLIPWLPIKLSGRPIRSTGADIVFGAVDTGLLAVAALIGAELAGIFGAIVVHRIERLLGGVGGLVGDSITDGLAGMFEGRAAESLRAHGIEEARTAMSASMGKMSGCLLGAGATLTIAWTIIGIALPW